MGRGRLTGDKEDTWVTRGLRVRVVGGDAACEGAKGTVVSMTPRGARVRVARSRSRDREVTKDTSE